MVLGLPTPIGELLAGGLGLLIIMVLIGFFWGLFPSGGSGSNNSSNSSSSRSGPRINNANIERRGGGAPQDGDSYDNLAIRVDIADTGGSGLNELKLNFEGEDSPVIDMGGNGRYRSSHRISWVPGGGNVTSGEIYQYEIKATDNNGLESHYSDTFTLPGTPDPGPRGPPGEDGEDGEDGDDGPPGPGGGGGSGDVDIDITDLVEISMGQSQQQQQQQMQQMMMWANLMQQQMQQQQMQPMVNPAMMQFMNLIQGNNINQTGDTIIVPGGGGGQSAQVDIDIVQQLIQVLIQSDIDQEYMMSMIALLLTEGGDEINNQLIQQMINIVVEENEGDITIEQEITQIINKKYIQEIEQTLVKVIEQEFNLTKVQQQFSIQIVDFFQAIINKSFDIEGDQVIINIDGPNLEIHYTTLIQFIKLINQLPESLIKPLVLAIVNDIVIDGDYEEINVNVIKQILILIKEAESGDLDESDTGGNVEIKIEGLELVNTETGNPLKKVKTDDGSIVYIIPDGYRTDQIGIHALVGSNETNGLQQIIFNFDGNQQTIGLNATNYGHEDEEIMPVSQIVGEMEFQQGQMHNFGVSIIGQRGGRENHIMQAEVGKKSLPGKEPKDPPALEPGEEKVKKTEEEINAVLKVSKREEGDLKNLLQDLKQGYEWYKDVEEKYEEVEKIHQQLGKGASISDLSQKQKRILKNDLDELQKMNDKMDGILELESQIKDEIERIKNKESKKERYTVELEKDEKKIEVSVKELEEYISKLEDLTAKSSNS